MPDAGIETNSVQATEQDLRDRLADLAARGTVRGDAYAQMVAVPGFGHLQERLGEIIQEFDWATPPGRSATAPTKTIKTISPAVEHVLHARHGQDDKQVKHARHVDQGEQPGQAGQAIHAKQANHGEQGDHARDARIEARTGRQAVKQERQENPANFEEAARRLLADWSDYLRPVGERRLPFELARVLKNLKIAKPNVLQSVVKVFASSRHIDPEDFWCQFLDGWPRVIAPAGQDAFTLAAASAESRTLILRESHGRKYDLVVSFAFYVKEYATQGRIILPTPRLANWLQTYPKAVSSRINLAVEAEILSVLSRAQRHSGLANEYIFIGKEGNHFELPGGNGQ